MTVITTPQDFDEQDLFVDLTPLVQQRLFLKVEGFNFAGSIKLRTAAAMVDAAERNGVLRPDSVLVESTSGNLGVALATIAASKGYRFECVTDDRCNSSALRTMKALGARVHVVTEPLLDGGLLGARLALVRTMCAMDEKYVWLDQYRSAANWQAHFRATAPAIVREFPELDVLFVGAGTTGTLMGCARFLRQRRRPVRIIAVDAVGSVTFGGPSRHRCLPGLGAGVVPPMLDQRYVDEVLLVEETETVAACRQLARGGFLFGGSTGTVVHGAVRWLAEHGTPSTTAVAIAPDLGGRYLDTVYDPTWVDENLGKRVAESA